MRKLLAVLIGFSSLISCGIGTIQAIAPNGRFKITRKMCLTREAYYPSSYPCGLSQYEYIGNGSKIVKKIGMVPRGTIVTIERSYLKRDFYAPELISFRGKLSYNGKIFGCNGTFTHDEFARWFVRIIEE